MATVVYVDDGLMIPFIICSEMNALKFVSEYMEHRHIVAKGNSIEGYKARY